MTSNTSRYIRTAGLACTMLAVGTLASPAAPATEAGIGAVTVRAQRPVEKVVGRTSSGVPVVSYELTYKVGYEDLELASPGGADALRQRVREAATSVCADLDKMYPLTAPDDDCAHEAADEAMAQVKAAVEAARNR